MKALKFVVALVTTGLIALGAALTDDSVSSGEWIAIGLALLGAGGVYLAPNKPETPDAVKSVRGY